MYDSVRQLTAAIASGNTEAFTVLFRNRFDEMYAHARQVSGKDESFCLDVVQDAFVRIIRRIKPMESESHLQAWLRTVVQTCAWDRLRQESRRWRREVAAQASPERIAEARETRERMEWLRAELAALDDPNVRLLLLRYRMGWTLERIGKALGLKPGAVDGRINRLVSFLRRRAQETFHDG